MSAAIRIERLDLAAAAIEREHELPEQPLAIGVIDDERFQLADHGAMVTQSEVCLDTVFERGQACLLETRHLPSREPLIGQIAERLPTPQRQCGDEQLARAGGVAHRERVPRVRDRRLEPLRVDLLGLGRQQIAAAPCQQHPIAERLPQMRHVALKRLRRRGRRPLPPQQIDQTIGRDDVPATQDQDRQ